MMHAKPLVHFDVEKINRIMVGAPAVVCPINHPSPDVSNKKAVLTTNVISYDAATNTFETLNTIYKGARIS